MTAETTAAAGTTELTPYGIAMDALERIVDAIDDTMHRTYEDVREIASDAHRRAVLQWQGRPDTGDTAPATPVRFALVEQMGHRATYAAVREITFLGEPMLEVTDLRTGSIHTVSPKSLYEVSWLDEQTARSRAKPWTATAITAGRADADADDDQDDEPEELDTDIDTSPSTHVWGDDE